MISGGWFGRVYRRGMADNAIDNIVFLPRWIANLFLEYTFRDVLADILSSLKLGGSGVSVALRVAPLGVSVLPLHASLSTCNLDMSSPTLFWAECGGIPNQPMAGFIMEVSCMPSPKDLSTGLSTRDYSITVYKCFPQFISSLKVGAFLLTTCKFIRNAKPF